MGTNKLSVIIPVYDLSKDRIYPFFRLITSISSQTYSEYEVILANECEGKIYNKSMAINNAVRKTNYNNLLVLDADVCFESDYFKKVIKYALNKKIFIAFKKCRLLKGRDNVDERVAENCTLRALALAWYCDKDFFYEFGGMNEKYEGYGNEDVDAYLRAEHLNGSIGEIDYNIIHNYHHWHPVESCYPLNDRRKELLFETKNDITKEIERCQANNKKTK